jgi:hypothetical protein
MSSKNNAINSGVSRYIGHVSKMCRLAAGAAADVVVGVVIVVVGIVIAVVIMETPPEDGQWPIDGSPFAPVGCIGMGSMTMMATLLLLSLSR